MAESLTARLGIRKWGAGTDTPSRVEFNADHDALEAKCAIYLQGLFQDRPAAGVVGRFYFVTPATTVNAGQLFYDDGTVWTRVSPGTAGSFYNSGAHTANTSAFTFLGSDTTVVSLASTGKVAIQYGAKIAGTSLAKGQAGVVVLNGAMTLSQPTEWVDGPRSTDPLSVSGMKVVTLPPGVSTVHLGYRSDVNGQTVTFTERFIVATPL